MTSYDTARKRVPTLRRIGTWATWWWGVSCGYVLLLVWRAKDYYQAFGGHGFSLGNWARALRQAFTTSASLRVLLAAILLLWVLGGWLWLRELKRHKVSYKAAFKDLFLTIRK